MSFSSTRDFLVMVVTPESFDHSFFLLSSPFFFLCFFDLSLPCSIHLLHHPSQVLSFRVFPHIISSFSFTQTTSGCYELPIVGKRYSCHSCCTPLPLRPSLFIITPSSSSSSSLSFITLQHLIFASTVTFVSLAHLAEAVSNTLRIISSSYILISGLLSFLPLTINNSLPVRSFFDPPTLNTLTTIYSSFVVDVSSFPVDNDPNEEARSFKRLNDSEEETLRGGSGGSEGEEGDDGASFHIVALNVVTFVSLVIISSLFFHHE